jgi:hypothetical protein
MQTLSIDGDARNVYEHFESQGWSDGLPIIPPTAEAVSDALRYTDLPAEFSLGTIPPVQREATVESIAINAVMAGCRPEYLPVVLAAVQAAIDPCLNMIGLQATTNPVAPLVIVNGPAAEELGINAAGNCFGQGVRANVTIGRALKLCLLNIGGGSAPDMDKATHGQPAKYGLCVAENEAASPWEPMHVEAGLESATSAVTVISITGMQHVLEPASKSGVDVLRTISAACAYIGMQNLLLGGGPLVVLSPEHAHLIAQDGFSKQDVREFIYEAGRAPVHLFPEELFTGYIRTRRPARYWSDSSNAGVPVADSPEDINILVAGGDGPHAIIAPSFGHSVTPKTVQMTTKDGAPITFPVSPRG